MPFENEGELGPDLGLLVLGKDVDDAVDGLRGRVGVQGSEGQVAGFGDAQGGLDGFEISHLTDQDDVGVLTQNRSEGVGEGQGVGVQFALVDHRLLVGVQILDRVLDREDVQPLLAVDLVDHRGQGVDFPDPVGPVTSTRPRGFEHRLSTTVGSPSSRKPRIS